MSDDEKRGDVFKKLRAGFEKMPNTCLPGPGMDGSEGKFQLQWSAKGKGFGEFWFFYKEDENGKQVLHVDNECENRTFIKKMLCQMVDDAVLVDEPFRNEDGTNNE